VPSAVASAGRLTASVSASPASTTGAVANVSQTPASNVSAGDSGVVTWEQMSSQVTHDPALAARIAPLLDETDGAVSLAVKDLGTGHGVLLNGEREQQAASLFKLPVLYSVMRAGLDWDEPLEITDRIKSYDLGTLELGVGETLTVAEAVERMVTLSDNSSAILLADRVGGGQVNVNLASLGLDSTHYLADRLTTSAGDMLTLLELIARGQAVSPSASAEMVHLLLRQRINDRLPSRLPAGTAVAL
jgi:beta-lactamase class A